MKNEFIAYCDELPFRILSYSSYIYLNSKRVIFFVVTKNEHKLLGTKSVKLVEVLRKLKMPLFVGFLKTLRDNNKTHSNDDVSEEELLKYMRLINKIVSKPTIKVNLRNFPII